MTIQRAIKMLENVPDAEFGMERWKCGTVACLAGHMASSPEFPEMEFDRYNTPRTPLPGGGAYFGAEAVAQVLDVPHETAKGLCAVQSFAGLGGRYSPYYGKHIRDITRQDVLQALRGLL